MNSKCCPQSYPNITYDQIKTEFPNNLLFRFNIFIEFSFELVKYILFNLQINFLFSFTLILGPDNYFVQQQNSFKTMVADGPLYSLVVSHYSTFNHFIIADAHLQNYCLDRQMKQFNIEIVGSRTRKTVSDLKLKKSLQLIEQDLNKICNTVKFKPPTKLTPIIGQITVIPIKRESAIIREMLMGKQAVQVLSQAKQRVLVNSIAKQEKRSFKTQSKQQQKNYIKLGSQQAQIQMQTNQNQQEEEHSKSVSLKTIQQQSSLEQSLMKSQKQLVNKSIVQSKILPKIENQFKYLTERLTRPLLSGIDSSLKGVKSMHFFVISHEDSIPIIALRSKTKIEVASLTKIMTFYTTYKLAQQLKIDLKQKDLKIRQEMCWQPGTTASIQPSHVYNIEQLLYGMMLPSGNDASIALALWGGMIIQDNKSSNNLSKKQQQKIKMIKKDEMMNQDKQITRRDIQDEEIDDKYLRVWMNNFVAKMNECAKQIKMIDSSFGNPHGLPHKNNRTTCQDMAKLCSQCLNIPLFRKVVGTAVYTTKVYDRALKRKVPVQWQNTNKLLRRPGFLGIKTGITVTAGPCLASAYQFLDKTYIVIIAKCNKPSRRFKQTRRLLAHCLQRIDHGRPLTKQEQTVIKKLAKSNYEIDSDYSDEQVQFNFSSFSQDQIKRRARILTQI